MLAVEALDVWKMKRQRGKDDIKRILLSFISVINTIRPNTPYTCQRLTAYSGSDELFYLKCFHTFS